MWTELSKEEVLEKQAEHDRKVPAHAPKHVGAYFNNQIEVSAKPCKNANKESFRHCCNGTARAKFSTCQGCADNSRGDE